MGFNLNLERLDYATLVLLAIGLVDSAYLSLVELGGAPLVCSSNSIINCDAVIFSQYSSLFGIKLAFLGLAWFILATALFLFARKWGDYWNLTGIFAVIYSVAAMYQVGSICEYCALLDLALVSLFAISLYRLRKGSGPIPAAR